MAVVEAIATVYCEVDTASITWSSLGSYEHLQIRCNIKSDRSGSMVDGFQITFNGDTASNYSHHYMWGTSSSTSGNAFTSTRLNIQNQLAAQGGVTDAANFSTGIIDVLDYRNANKNTTVIATMGSTGNWSTVSFESGLWDSTAAVTSILLDQVNGPNFMRGSEFTLYGLNSS